VLRVPQSKIAVPPLPADFSSRPDVLAHLDRVAPGQLLVVSAPAG
jgi:ATP/maltotriose-dependent transcriptional regulator MalT